MFTSRRLVQFQNARRRMLVTLEGMDTLVRLSRFRKASSPMPYNLSNHVIVESSD